MIIVTASLYIFAIPAAQETIFGISQNELNLQNNNPARLLLKIQDISPTGYQKATVIFLKRPINTEDDTIIPKLSLKVNDNEYWSYDGSNQRFSQESNSFHNEVNFLCKEPIQNKQNNDCAEGKCDCTVPIQIESSLDTVTMVVAQGNFAESPIYTQQQTVENQPQINLIVKEQKIDPVNLALAIFGTLITFLSMLYQYILAKRGELSYA